MTPKDKANELVNRMTRPTPKNEDFYLYDDYYCDFNQYGKQCALIAVDEILLHEKENHSILDKSTEYWREVKKEIEAL